MTAFAVVQDNFRSVDWSNQTFWQLKLLDTKSSITILVSLLGLLVVTKKFVKSFSPYIVYESSFSPESKFGLVSQKVRFWSVTLRNAGLGTAVITNVSYKIAFTDGKICSANNSTVIDYFKENQLTYEKDFSVMRLSRGYAIASKEHVCIFEIPTENSSRVSLFDIKYEYKGFLGDRYTKEIHCIPHGGVSIENPVGS